MRVLLLWYVCVCVCVVDRPASRKKRSKTDTCVYPRPCGALPLQELFALALVGLHNVDRHGRLRVLAPTLLGSLHLGLALRPLLRLLRRHVSLVRLVLNVRDMRRLLGPRLLVRGELAVPLVEGVDQQTVRDQEGIAEIL
jgi:hypothetical protein